MIPHYETPDLARLCLRSICRHTKSVPYEVIVEHLGDERDPGKNPLFQVMLALHSDVASDMKISGLTLESAGVSNETT